eukprot:1195567-Prorocentrum_minimum.AAC.6
MEESMLRSRHFHSGYGHVTFNSTASGIWRRACDKSREHPYVLASVRSHPHRPHVCIPRLQGGVAWDAHQSMS